MVVIDQPLTIVQLRQRAQKHWQLVPFIYVLAPHDIDAELRQPYRGYNDAYESAYDRPVRNDSHHLSYFSLHIQSTLKMRSWFCDGVGVVLTAAILSLRSIAKCVRIEFVLKLPT
ncbi:hypothetical protein FEP48_05625 [Burkholderia multivorans]|nr:hypothetical protein [Burkholderia multivorans]MDR9078133.1 hypothetical protein [Burkholderia multivorans]MDR9095702.1 hypothetical protein [Burkholderia multivorans]MDR9119513.1 hypothetical protein [Burkholderia multivorans]MDR9160092.1 hypothetical protein [Burkholderia multivorans]